MAEVSSELLDAFKRMEAEDAANGIPVLAPLFFEGRPEMPDSKPTKPGFYWYKALPDQPSQIVYMVGDGTLLLMSVHAQTDDLTGQWGPEIPRPREEGQVPPGHIDPLL